MGSHDVLFSQILARDLVRQTPTNANITLPVQSPYRARFDLHRLLPRFFGEPAQVKEFRQIQSQTETIISGSMTLQFFNRLTWSNTDLDLYVTRASAALAVFFLVEKRVHV
jgi:hypothetical protein